MKTLLKYVLIILVFFCALNTNAQLLSKLKSKVENAVSGNDNLEQNTQENSAFGSVIITHSAAYSPVNIKEVSEIRIERTNNAYSFKGSWWSHKADIHDGFFLTVKTKDNLSHDVDASNKVKRTFKIPEDATLKLSYDPNLPYYKESNTNFKKAVTDDYQTYDISKGEVTIDVLSEQNIQISFNGKVSLRKIIRHSNNAEDYSESFFEASVKGGIDGVSPIIINNQSITKDDEAKGVVRTWDGMVEDNSVPLEKPGVYQFSCETIVKVSTPEQKRAYNMSYLLNPNSTYLGIKVDMAEYSDEDMAGKSILIMDNGNSHIFVETGGVKMQMSQSMMGTQQMQNPAELMTDYDYTHLKKTGKTKTILSAKCYEYVMSDNSVTMNMWVAPDVNLPNWFIQNTEVLEGHIMEYSIKSKEGIMTSEIIAIHDNISMTINPKDYKKMF